MAFEDSRYHIVDHQTGNKVTDKGYSHAQRNRARNAAEKKPVVKQIEVSRFGGIGQGLGWLN